MSEDLNKRIRQLTELLSQENMTDNIKALLTLLSSTNSSEESGRVLSAPKEEIHQNKDMEDNNVELIRKAKKVMDRLTTKDDPQINLLSAVKPFLNDKRQKKLDNCIKMVHMSKLTNFLDE